MDRLDIHTSTSGRYSFEVTQRRIGACPEAQGGSSSRLGLDADVREAHDPLYDENTASLLGKIRYELTDHLGNVCAVVSDNITGHSTDADPDAEEYRVELLSAQEYEPFGSLLPGRNYSSGSYRHLFQGQEHDDELNGAAGTSYAYEYRIHDPRVGRFLSIDPLAAKYAYNSPYAFSENRVIDGVELEGLEVVLNQDRQVDGVTVGMNIGKTNDRDGGAVPVNKTETFNHTINDEGRVTNPDANGTSVNMLTQRMAQGRVEKTALPRGAGIINSATTGNTPSLVINPIVESFFPNQFDQGFVMSSGAGAPAALPPNLLGSLTSNIQNPRGAVAMAGGPGGRLVQTMANNVSRVIIVTNGTPAANAAAIAAARALPGAVGNGRLMIQVVSAPALIAAQNSAGVGNPQSVLGLFNPTQAGLGGMLPAGAARLYQTPNWTPMLAVPPIVPLVRSDTGRRMPFQAP